MGGGGEGGGGMGGGGEGGGGVGGGGAPASDFESDSVPNGLMFSGEARAVLQGFRTHSSPFVLFVGDSIAEELAQYLKRQLGFDGGGDVHGVISASQNANTARVKSAAMQARR